MSLRAAGNTARKSGTASAAAAASVPVKDYLCLHDNVVVRRMLIKANPSVMEEVKFSDLVVKINRQGKRQERVLLVTDKAMYNLGPSDKSLKRRIPLETLHSLTFSTSSDEFAIHVPSEYDYRFMSYRRAEVVETIALLYKILTNRKFPVYTVDEAELTEVTITKDVKKRLATDGVTAETKLAAVDRKIIDEDDDFEETKARSRATTGWSREKTDVTAADFEPLKVVGRGAFGKVMLVRYKKSGQLYAMKVLSKEAIIARNQVEHTMAEREILESVEHPFLVSLRFAFQSPAKLYLGLDYIAGGELFFHLQREGHFSEARTRFYAAEIALGIGHLHSLGIIYRDLKPENILMDAEGHIKLTDFGLSKRVQGPQAATTFCGTPEYLAPEILAETGHDKEVDWWSFGVLVYEMLVGIPPFYSENVSRMYEMIAAGELRVPEHLSEAAKSLVVALLQRNPRDRLGYGRADIEAVKAHPFFATLDWAALLAKRIAPEFKPDVRGEGDTSNFDSEFTSEPIRESVAPVTSRTAAGGDFDGFNYTGSKAAARLKPVSEVDGGEE